MSVYTITKEEIISESLEILGVLGEGESPSSDQINSLTKPLNMLIKAWQQEGIHLWAVETVEVPLTVGKTEYTMGSGQDVDLTYNPVRIVEGVYRNQDGYDIPINIWSREEYWSLAYKDSEGTPLNLYFDPQREYATIYVWQAPSVENTKLVLQVQRGLEFPENDSSQIKFPGEYLLALTYNLARAVATKYGVPAQTQQFITRQAIEYKQEAYAYNQEYASVFIQPDPIGGHYGYG